MPLEVATNIAELDDTWPLVGDPTNEGDNHIRLLKDVLKLQFPGSGGDGFASAITATEEEINYLSGATSNIQAQIDANRTEGLQIGVGMRFLCRASSLPTNGFWSLFTSDNDLLPRIVNTLDVSSGGSWNINGFTTIANDTDNTSLGSHTHSAGSYDTGGASSTFTNEGTAGGTTFVGLHSHDVNGTSGSTNLGSHKHDIPSLTVQNTGAWRPAYRNSVWLQYDG